MNYSFPCVCIPMLLFTYPYGKERPEKNRRKTERNGIHERKQHQQSAVIKLKQKVKSQMMFYSQVDWLKGIFVPFISLQHIGMCIEVSHNAKKRK